MRSMGTRPTNVLSQKCSAELAMDDEQQTSPFHRALPDCLWLWRLLGMNPDELLMVRYDKLVAASLIVLILATGCASAGPTTPTAEPETGMPTVVSSAADLAPTGPVADVISIDVQGEPGRYAFSVEIESTDQGCEQYADWWEVISEEGTLIYRRILLHSHVNEQPFTRSGGPVDVAPGTTVWVRAHMNSGGYGGQAFKGSVKTGFAPAEMPAGFAEGLAEQVPLPDGCAF